MPLQTPNPDRSITDRQTARHLAPIRSVLRRSGLLLATALLVACGGGGGGGGDGGGSGGGSIPPVVDPLIIKGRYVTDPNVAPAYTVLVVPAAGGGSDQAWAVSTSGDTLIRLSLTSSLAVTGQRYKLTDPIGRESIMGTAVLEGTASSASLRLPGLIAVSSATTLLTRTDRLTDAAVQATVAGAWTGQFDAGARTLTWTVASGGQLTGNSNTGCTYTGSLVARTDASVFDVSFDQTCPTVPTPTTLRFSGVARPSSASSLTVVAVSADEVVPWVGLMQK